MHTFQLPFLIWQALPGCGPRRWQQLAQLYPNWPAPLVQADAALLARLPKTAALALVRRDWQCYVDQVEAWCAASPEHHLVTLADADYPPLLAQIDDAPPVLFVRGNRQALNLPQLAIVGSRHASHQGNSNAFAFARDIAAQGLAITSGLALGIDAAAHRGALAASGHTLGVLGTGVDRIYPASHQGLAQDILQAGGALLSEFPLGAQPQRAFFPRRNRLISGLSVGVMVVEAAVKSGSLSTAHHAMHQGRTVFAIPGSIHSPLSRGCHALIRDGATLIDSSDQIAEDILPLLAYHFSQQANAFVSAAVTGTAIKMAAPAAMPIRPEERDAAPAHPLWRWLDDQPRSADELQALSDLAIDDILGQLLAWELEGQVVLEATGYVRCRGPLR